jgi:lactate dehydrogenase-like 2-hydroxyacid dehydrogenase
MTEHTIVTTLPLSEAANSLLQTAGVLLGPDDWQSHLPRANGLITPVNIPVDDSLLARSPLLKVVANAGVGYNNIDLAACRERGVTVTNTPDVLTDATADLAMALLLATVRKIPQAEATVRRGDFKGWGFWDHIGGDVTGARLGIFGMGRIGRAVARRARGFEMVIQYHNRTRLPGEVEQKENATWVDWETLLTTSDILTLHAPYSPATHHLLDREALRRMKPGSYVINTARGAMIDESALVEALKSGHLAGAGLDVYEHEPRIHPGLFELPNVVLLPHIGSAAPSTRKAMAMLAARNVHAVLTIGRALTPVL